MPIVLFINGYQFRFYSNENDEPPHIHVFKGNGKAKFWLLPAVIEAYSYGYTVREQRDIRTLVIENKDLFLNKWYGFFGE
jgi:hypothetical protein